jgi:geranylgeranyl pyrophosphate synthase
VTLAAYLDALRADVERALTARLALADAPAVVVEAMRYAAMAGGKRFRPCLTLTVAERVADRAGVSVADARARALPAACAVEMVHCYSLVHDDLPGMDDDTLRRGRPTTHVVYGEGMAILAGDGLLTEAFAALTADAPAPVPPAERRLAMAVVLARAAGAIGMVGGQAIDLAGAGRVPNHVAAAFDAPALADMHARKTGALIRAAATLGALAAGADARTVAAVDDYARELGLAFQIVDDLLDVEGSTASLGKTAGKDAAAGKPTFPAIHGLDASRALAAACIDRAIASLNGADLAGHLTDIAHWTLDRRA